jgi:hypothetical protein
MKEFGSFHKKTQRYIRQSLDVAYERGDPIATWGRTEEERHNIRMQIHNYNLLLSRTRSRLARSGRVDIGHVEHVMGPLISLAVFDLSNGCLPGFGPFRFLYERLFGAEVRPWLPSTYVGAAALPLLTSGHRCSQLRAISEKACSSDDWSKMEPEFIPEWVDKVEPPPKRLPAA